MESFISNDPFSVGKQKLKNIEVERQEEIRKMKWKISLIYDAVIYFEETMKMHKELLIKVMNDERNGIKRKQRKSEENIFTLLKEYDENAYNTETHK